jgi:large subunit ribosomal protein L7Ae
MKEVIHMAIVNYEVPKEAVNKSYEAITVAKATGKIRIGVNESTKAIERGLAKLIVIATDVSPEEVVMHLPVLCDEKKVPCSFVPSKEELGRSAGISVPTSSIAITEEGDGKRLVADVAGAMTKAKGGPAE